MYICAILQAGVTTGTALWKADKTNAMLVLGKCHTTVQYKAQEQILMGARLLFHLKWMQRMRLVSLQSLLNKTRIVVQQLSLHVHPTYIFDIHLPLTKYPCVPSCFSITGLRHLKPGIPTSVPHLSKLAVSKSRYTSACRIAAAAAAARLVDSAVVSLSDNCLTYTRQSYSSVSSSNAYKSISSRQQCMRSNAQQSFGSAAASLS